MQLPENLRAELERIVSKELFEGPFDDQRDGGNLVNKVLLGVCWREKIMGEMLSAELKQNLINWLIQIAPIGIGEFRDSRVFQNDAGKEYLEKLSTHFPQAYTSIFGE